MTTLSTRISQNVLAKRVLVVLVLLPVGLAAIWYDGQFYVALVSIILVVAAWEYYHLFRVGGFKPSGAVLIGGTLLLTLGRAASGFADMGWMIGLILVSAMAIHLFAFERGRIESGTDFTVTISGALYVGWLGAYLISIRDLPEGRFWLLTVLPAIWFADTGAYTIGRRFGRHRMAPRLSPKKSWEGYFAGVAASVVFTGLLAGVLSILAGSEIAVSPANASLIALVLSSLSPLGDFGESMLKRQMGVKDSSHILPGHGGIFDRIDSWLWGVLLGYYLIVWLFI